MDVTKVSPSDAVPYFSVPVETQIKNPTLGSQVCGQDPQRVLLIVSNIGNAFALSTNPTSISAKGIFVPAAAGYIVITYEEYGILVNQAWYLSSYNLGDVTTITIDLLDDIRVGNKLDNRLKLLQSPATPAKISTAPGVGGGKGLLDYWAKLVAKFGGKG